MASTYLALNYHLVFSTKDRRPWIAPAWRNRLHAYLGGCVRTLNGTPDAVGGVADHVHLLVGLRATHRLCDVLEEIKRESSKWVHRELGLAEFAWQEGYAAITVSPGLRSQVKGYIARQEQHHRRRDFVAELKEFLAKAEIRYDEKYLL
jgi:REP element-mobilizing transposase RayT